jgi:hypothetical protein
MFQNAFIGSTAAPTDTDLAANLGRAKPAWDRLLESLARELDVSGHEWKSHAAKWGWSLRVLRKQRTIVWLSPGREGFQAVFILGDKAVAAARASRLPARIKAALAAAPKYPEGTGLRLLVKSPRPLAALKILAAIKLAH